jgi:hypothetical protein
MSTLWSLRILEKLKGSYFFLKSTLLILIVESCICILVLYLINKYIRPQFGDAHPLLNININGSSGFVMAWMAYASIVIPFHEDPIYRNSSFYLLGMIPLSWSLAIIFVMISSSLISPRESAISNMTGIVTGYMLLAKILDVPNTYWLLCLVFNIIALITSSALAVYSPLDNIQANNQNDNENSPSFTNMNLRELFADDDTVEVLQLGNDPVTLGPRILPWERSYVDHVDDNLHYTSMLSNLNSSIAYNGYQTSPELSAENMFQLPSTNTPPELNNNNSTENSYLSTITNGFSRRNSRNRSTSSADNHYEINHEPNHDRNYNHRARIQQPTINRGNYVYLRLRVLAFTLFCYRITIQYIR